jgi:hypothetical protein
MKNIKELHSQHLQLNSEIAFLKQEISFFLKLLSKAYNDTTQSPRIKLLDGYWKEFEKCRDQLESVAQRIENCEKHAKSLYAEKGITRCQDDEECSMGLNAITKELKVIKESFYNFIIEENKSVYEKA